MSDLGEAFGYLGGEVSRAAGELQRARSEPETKRQLRMSGCRRGAEDMDSLLLVNPSGATRARGAGRSSLTGLSALSLCLAVAASSIGCSGGPERREPSEASKQRTPAGAPENARPSEPESPAAPEKAPQGGATPDRAGKPEAPPQDGAGRGAGAGAGGGGDQRLSDTARLSSLQDQERKALSQNYYKTGKEHHDKFRYREAAADLKIAVDADKDNVEARKLYDKTLWILGDRRGEAYDMARELANSRLAAIKQAQIEVERLYNEGDQLASTEKYGAAIERFERVLEALRWFPYNIDSSGLKDKATAAIDQARTQREEQVRKFRRLQQEAAIEEAKAEKARNIRYIEARLRSLYRQALEAYKSQRYEKCEEICTEILTARPDNLQASRLQRAAIQLRHRKEEREIYYNKVENVRRVIEWVDESAVPYQSIFRFPGRDEWSEIAKRELKVRDFLQTSESPEVAEINRRLNSQRVDLNFQQTPFADCINFLRDITGINFVVGQTAQDLISNENLEVSLRLKSISLKNALQLILSVNAELVSTIKNGVVFITTKEGDKKELFLEFYEVSDIINKLPDYPAPELGLSQQGAGGGGGGGGRGSPGGVLTFDDEGDDENSGTGVGADKLVELVQRVAGEEEGQEDISGGILIVRRPAETHKKIAKLLDALRKTVGIMVTVEARFVEVQDNFLEQIGVDLTGLDQFRPNPNIANTFLPTNIFFPRGGGGPPSVNSGVDFTDAQGEVNVRASMINLLSNTIGNGAGNPFNLVTNGGGAFQYNVLTDQFRLQAVLEAVKKKQRAKQVSSPRVTVFNGQRAHLLSVNQRAYIQDVEVNQTGVIPVLNPVISILNTGSILDVRPTVSYDRKYVMMEVRPTQALQTGTRSSVVTLAGANTSIPIELPTIVIQRIRTSVTVPDGGTVLIGGIKDVQEQYDETLTPIVGKIPVVKNLFRRQGRAALKRSLIVLLKAKISILRDEEKAKFGT